MIRVAFLILLAAVPVLGQEKIDRALVERFRALTPEQKARLRERVEALRRLTPAERARLKENLDKFRAFAPERQKAIRERLERMSPEERRKAVELATGFFRWLNARYEHHRFPRGAFFRWMAANRRDAFEELKGLDPLERKDAFLRLAHEYRVVRLHQLRQHVRRHGCGSPEDLAALEAEDFGRFWEQAESFVRRCAPPPKGPGPRTR